MTEERTLNVPARPLRDRSPYAFPSMPSSLKLDPPLCAVEQWDPSREATVATQPSIVLKRPYLCHRLQLDLRSSLIDIDWGIEEVKLNGICEIWMVFFEDLAAGLFTVMMGVLESVTRRQASAGFFGVLDKKTVVGFEEWSSSSSKATSMVLERGKEGDRYGLSQNVSARVHGPGSGVLSPTAMTCTIWISLLTTTNTYLSNV
ncbi:uncharacterized protein ARMOST_07668 [Armillaria ostoyae]|uniref:Uncharacterized protein n=1 Tax=Armillaria ostoyae TaxID=47428 RepID=A0A284R6G0_ARMOS|nr:uncharacterized protein ARMOST_07668 [Armillaria ostoyae]